MEAPRAHAVCIPLPAQGHINPMLKLAKLLHSRGFYITFVHTEFNYHRTTHPTPPAGFHFQTISDGLPPTNPRGIADLPALVQSMPIHCLNSFRQLIHRLMTTDSSSPPVSCIVSDGVMGFTLEVAREFNIPEILFFTVSACGMLGYLQFQKLIDQGHFPLKDETYLWNGYLDRTNVDWTPPSMASIRLSDLPTFLRTTDENDIMFNYNLESVNKALKKGSLILNTFDELERDVLDVLQTKFDNVYTIGPLNLLSDQICEGEQESLDSSLWKEDKKCLDWLDGKQPRSVVYVNYGSLVIMTPAQLSEFAWGLANSMYAFLWVIRPNLVEGGTEIISSSGFMDEIKDRGLILEWCPQAKVLRHPSIGRFLTHCGWNSTLESISEGVPMMCWPFFAEQQMNCLYICSEWGIGMEIGSDVKRGEIEVLVKELMEGKKGVEIREKVMEWKRRAKKATSPGGSSFIHFNLLLETLKTGKSTATTM